MMCIEYEMDVEDYENLYEDLSNEELLEEFECWLLSDDCSGSVAKKREALRNVMLNRMGGKQNEGKSV